MHEFKMPSLGADMVEGKIVRWMVKPGDRVKKGDAVVEVDTQKAAVEVQIWEGGVIENFLVNEGEVVPVGQAILRLRETEEVTRAKISPAARRLAEELHVSFDDLKGTGPEGAITMADIQGAATQKGTPPSQAKPQASQPSSEDRSREMRKAIGAAMARSKKEIPHYYLATTVILKKATEFLLKINVDLPVTERILMPALLFRAVALALKEYPEFNGYWRDGQFVPAQSVNLGVAISLRSGGLVAPAILNAQALSLGQTMKSMLDLVTRTREGGLKSSEYTEATITVTNLGERGSDVVLGVIYPPQVALVGAGGIVERPWVIDGKVSVAPVMSLTLAADHRASDGHRGSLFLEAVKSLLEEPEKLGEPS